MSRKGAATTIRRRSDLELVGQAADGEEALDAIRSLRPDVALLDEEMPRLGGLEVLSGAAAEGLPTRVVLISEAADGERVHQAVVAGAAGYLTKGDSLWSICEAIRKAAAGERHLSTDAQAALLDHLKNDSRRLQPALSARELEILELTARGISSARIGAQLHLSQSTVKNHQRHIYDKLGVSTAAAATYEAMRRGILR